MTDAVPLGGPRFLNHVGPFVFKRGERNLAKRVFSALGCAVVTDEGRLLTIAIDATRTGPDNVLYAWEQTDEQAALDDALAGVLHTDPTTRSAFTAYDQLRCRTAFEAPHFGIRLDSELDMVRQQQTIEALPPDLSDRLFVASPIFRTTDAATGEQTVQLFARTDVIAVGMLAFSQFVEYQVRTFG